MRQVGWPITAGVAVNWGVFGFSVWLGLLDRGVLYLPVESPSVTS